MVKVERILAVNMKTLLEDKMFSDLTLVVEGEEIKAHKAILAARSPRFRKLFIENPGKSEFEVSDVTKEVFDGVLRFIYCGCVKNLKVNLELMKAAGIYEIGGLKKICESQLVSNLTGANVAEIFQVAHHFDSLVLKRAAFRVIQR